MKQLYILFFILFSFKANSQIVHVPDALFKQILLQECDQNSDGEIQVSEALAVVRLDISFLGGLGDTVRSMEGIREFKNLNYLRAIYTEVTQLDLSGLSLLHNLELHSFPLLDSINFTGCTSLTSVDILQRTKLVNFNLHDLPSLRGLFLSAEISQPNPVPVQVMAENHPNLMFVTLKGTVLGDVNLANCPNLTRVDIDNYRNLGKLNVRSCTSLLNLDVTGGSMLELDLWDCTALSNVMITGTGLGLVDFTNCTSLTNAYLSFGSLPPMIDLSTAAMLNTLTLRIFNSGGNRSYLNLKNGRFTNTYLTGSADADSLYICADGMEVDSIIANANIAGFVYTNFIVDSTCPFLPQGPLHTIDGIVKQDMESVGCAAAPGCGNFRIRIQDSTGASVTKFTSAAGTFTHNLYEGTYTINPRPGSPAFSVTPQTAIVTFDGGTSQTQSVQFCVEPNLWISDLEVVIIPFSATRPGFPAKYILKYTNKGTLVNSGTVSFTFDPELMTVANLSRAPISQVPGLITWSFHNLEPFQSGTVMIELTLNPPPSNNIDDTLVFLAEIEGEEDDVELDNNFFLLHQQITGAYDPNDKTCLNGESITPSALSENLHYLIRFQNLGNDTAFNVRIVDSLQSALLAETLEIVAVSHEFIATLKDNILTIDLQNILLPPASQNEPASHGYVLFKVKPSMALQTGDQIRNDAGIYFDFNLPIFTNTAVTTVSQLSQTPVTISEFSGRKVNAQNHLTWKVVFGEPSVKVLLSRSRDNTSFQQLYDRWMVKSSSGRPTLFEDVNAGDSSTWYKLTVKSSRGVILKEEIIFLGAPASGISITGIVPVGGGMNVMIDAQSGGVFESAVVALDGKMMNTRKIALQSGSNTIYIPFSRAAGGLYSFVIYTKGKEKVSKLFVWNGR